MIKTIFTTRVFRYFDKMQIQNDKILFFFRLGRVGPFNSRLTTVICAKVFFHYWYSKNTNKSSLDFRTTNPAGLVFKNEASGRFIGALRPQWPRFFPPFRRGRVPIVSCVLHYVHIFLRSKIRACVWFFFLARIGFLVSSDDWWFVSARPWFLTSAFFYGIVNVVCFMCNNNNALCGRFVLENIVCFFGLRFIE